MKRLDTMAKLGLAVLMIGAVAVAGFAAGTEESEGTIGKDATFNATGLPIFDAPVTYSVMVRHPELAKKNYSEKEIFKRWTEETNVVIEWEEVAASGFVEKLNLVVASGVLPDATFAGGLGGGNFADAIDAGQVIPIDDYLQYAPNLRKALEIYPKGRTLSTYLEDGKMYRYPGFGLKYYAAYRAPLFINKQWLDNLGLEIPRTTDEYYQVLKAFKLQDANGNGNRNDEIPVSFCNLGWLGLGPNFLEALFPAWGIQGVRNGPFGTSGEMTIRDGKLHFHAIEDRYREALEYVHRLFSEGLMDQESLTQGNGAVTAKLNTDVPIIGSFVDWNLPAQNADQYVALEPLIGPYGDQFAIWNWSEFAIYSGLQIFSSCERPEGLIRWVDHMNEGTNAVELFAGPEGMAWVRNEADKTWRQNLRKLEELGVSFEEYRQTEGVQSGPQMTHIPEIVGYTYDPVPGSAEAIKTEWTEMARPYFFEENWTGSFPLVRPTEEDEEMGFIWSDLKSYLQIFVADAVINGVDDAKWRRHVAECEKLQYERVVEYSQRKYDSLR